mmetsp:Transcript_1761/g.4004  ORF Transcript_1761/g.4004 Transcript_1761/m.4004 type:complete len:244 (-) Transcript_1761:732-1463(-)
MAASMTDSAAAGAATLHAAMAPFATLFPSRSRRRAASSVANLAPSSITRERPRVCSTDPFSTSVFPNATRELARRAASWSALSPIPMRRMQWCSRPGPSRPCAISNPRPSPSNMLSTAGTRTFSNRVSACPCGASSYPNTGKCRTTVTPGASIGTSTILCCLCLGASGDVFPMKMASRHRGSHAPLVHHLSPLTRKSSPSTTMLERMLVASEDATSGSVMAKHERISPRNKGASHWRCCCSVP